MTSNTDENGKGEDNRRDDHHQTGKDALEFINIDATQHTVHQPCQISRPLLGCPQHSLYHPLAVGISNLGGRVLIYLGIITVLGPTTVKCKHQLANHRGHQLHAK